MDPRPPDFKKQVGARLGELLKAQGLTPLQIERQSKADGSKLDRTYIYDIVKGEANWSIDHLARILSYCHSSLEAFFLGLQKSDIPTADQPFHRMLNTILTSEDLDLRFGIRVNLEAISEKALRTGDRAPPASVRKSRRA